MPSEEQVELVDQLKAKWDDVNSRCERLPVGCTQCAKVLLLLISCRCVVDVVWSIWWSTH